MLTVLLVLAVCFLAYSNGANDNFKGVATLFGCGALDYRRALAFATLTTFAGSVCSVFLAGALVQNFSGKGLVPDAWVADPAFLAAVALGAAATVILATRLGFPVSTTHGLTGALVGAGLVAAGSDLNIAKLGGAFFLPLLLSPFLALFGGAVLYLILHRLRVRSGVTCESCLCVGETAAPVAVPAAAGARMDALAAVAAPMPAPMPMLAAGVSTENACATRYAGTYWGLNAQKALDALHVLSAGAVSFARGLNDTPKIVGLLLVLNALGVAWPQAALAAAVAACMAAGGVLHARRVAETMSKRIMPLNHGQGFTANVVTAGLVIGASVAGLPVSTTHVSVGSLFGLGLVTGSADKKVCGQIVLSWLLTLPLAAALAAGSYALLA